MRSNDEIISLIDSLREEHGLSISELARRVGMAKSALSRYFNKTREFPLNRVEDFSKVLGVSSEYILGFEETDTVIEKTVETMKSLNTSRKQKVYTYATEQLHEQESAKVAHLPSKRKKKEEIIDLAAHSEIDGRVYSKEEIKGIMEYLDQFVDE